MTKICEEKILSIQEYSICQRVVFKINFLLKKNRYATCQGTTTGISFNKHDMVTFKDEMIL